MRWCVMLPYINIFGNNVGTYMLCILVGIFVSGIYVCLTAKKRGYDDNDYIVFLLIAAIGVFVGGHLMYGITQIRVFIEVVTHLSKYITSFTAFIGIASYIFGGSVFYGGLLGGMLICVVYAKIRKLDLSVYSDICAGFVPLFHFFGRIGCFFGGCCYGIESNFGFITNDNIVNPSINGVVRFPVQLLEAALNLGLFFLFAYLLRKNKLKGGLFVLYLLIYSVIRFFDEFLRGDSYRGFLFGLSTSQIISILLFVGAVVYFICCFRRRKNTAKL